MYNDKRQKTIRRALRRNQTDAESKVWRYLRNRQIEDSKFFRQYSVGQYILDLYCPALRLSIEIDGGQHDEQVKKYDEVRTAYLESNDIKVLRFWNNEVLNNIEGVMEKITGEIDELK